MGDIEEKGRQFAFLDAFVDPSARNRDEHDNTATRKPHVSLVILGQSFKPLAAFLERSFPPVGASARGRLANNWQQIFRHLDEWKLNERHIIYSNNMNTVVN